MATKGIKEISLGTNDSYLIEPTLYTIIKQTSAAAAFTADLDKFQLFNGIAVAVKFGVTNNANATLNINSTGDIPIQYNGAAITASVLKENHIYNFVYDGTNWQLIGNAIGTEASDAAAGNHVHGNITNDGKIGTATSRAVYTTTGGLLTAGSLSVTDDTTVGDTATTFVAKVTQNGIGKITVTKAALPTATTDTAGITKVGASGGAAAYNHNHDSTYLKLDGSNNMSNDIGIIFGDTDKFLHFKYSTGTLIDNSWRTGVLGSGRGDSNYYVIQSGGVNNSTSGTWVTALQIGQQTYDVGFAGNVYPINTTQTLGNSSQRWSDGYYNSHIYVGPTTYTAYNSNETGTYIEPGGIGLSNTTAQRGYYLRGGSTQYARMYINAIGAASTANAQGALGGATLELGNNIARGASGTTDGAHNARGYIKLYSSGSVFTQIVSNLSGTKNYNFWLPNYAGDAYATHVASTAKVGDTNIPVYVAANGRITAGDALKALAYKDSLTYSDVGAAPTSHTHSYITSKGDVTAEADSTKPAQKGLSMQNARNNGYPTAYGNILTMYGGGATQLFMGWSGTSTASQGVHADAYIRSQRDLTETLWSDWAKLLDEKNTYAEKSDGSVISLSRNTETTLATINGVTVKIKLPASDNTDTKVNVVASAAGITKNYILMTATAPSSTASAQTAQASTRLWVNATDKGKFELVLGNNTATTTSGGQYGQLALYSASTAGTYLKAADGTAWSIATLQAKTGTIALTSDIPTNLNQLTNGPGYVTSSGVTSITLKAGAGITLDTDNTAITTTGTRTISINGLNSSSGSTTKWLNQKGEWSTPTYSDVGAATAGHTHGNLSNDGKLDNVNTLMWTNSSGQIYAGYHYASTAKIAINSSAEPSYNLYVNGSTGINLGTNDTTNKHKFVVLGNNRHLSIGGAGIQEYDSSNAASTLSLQYYGGSIQIGNTNDVEIIGKALFATANGFTYSGIGTASDNVSRPVWFSYNGVVGRPVYDNDFKYNPSTNVLTIGTGTLSATEYSGNAATASNTYYTKYYWHDLFGFCYVATPTYETTTDNSSWTTSDVNKVIFNQKNTDGLALFENNIIAHRWTWHSSSFSYSGGKFLAMSWRYADPKATVEVKFETSTDGTTWTQRGTISGSWSSTNSTLEIDGYTNASYIRITISKTSTNGTSVLTNLRLLSSRAGDQGQGIEYEFPYQWDKDRNIIFYRTIYPVDNSKDNLNIGLPSRYWQNAYITNIYSSSAAFTGAVTVQAPTTDANPATKKYVDDQITASFAANDAMVFKGVLNKDATETTTTLKNVPKNGYSAGWTYRVAKEGTYAGVACEVGDIVIAVTDATANQTAVNNAHWNVIQANIDGAVVSSSTSSTSNAIARFDGESGRIIKNSGITIDDNNTIYRDGVSINWNKANTRALLRLTSASGWSPILSLKAHSGWWSMGHFENGNYYDHLLFTFLSDVDVSGTENAQNHMDYTVRLLPTIYNSNTSTTTNRAFVTAPWTNNKATVGTTTQPVYIDDNGVATACTSYANASVNYANSAGSAASMTGIVEVANGGTGQTTKLGAGLIYNWTGVVQGQTWSKICYVPCSTSVIGSSILLNVGATRNAVVYNYTFLINTHHKSKCNINVLQGSEYSSIKIRVLVNSSGSAIIELYDGANSIANTTTQNVKCYMLVLTKGATEPTLYTTFTDGTTIDTDYTAIELNLVANGGFQTNKSIYATTFKGDLNGNATTATSSKVLANLYGDYNVSQSTTTRPDTANITHVTNGGVTHFKVTSKTNATGKPMANGNILHFHWDTSVAWDSQLFIPVESTDTSMQWRSSSAAGTWDSWRTLLDSNNYTSYALDWSEIKQSGADNLIEGSLNWTDNTEILTSYASNNGFADPNAKGKVYRRDAICAYNYIKGKTDSVYLKLDGTNTMTGVLNIKPASGEGGELHLCASTTNTTEAGIVLDHLSNSLRIFGIASADGTTKTGTGTPLVIDPYTKTITGGYTITGSLSGNATSASKISATLNQTTKTYLLGTTTTITATAANVSLTGDTGVYLTTTAGELSAYRYSWHYGANEKAYTTYNSTDDSIDFIFV